MNLDDIEVGQSYEFTGQLKQHHFVQFSQHRKHRWRIPDHLFDRYGHGPWLVVDKGLPYGKRGIKVGVQAEYTYTKPRMCPTCKYGFLRDEEDKIIQDPAGTITILVPTQMVVGRWDQRDLRRDLTQLVWDEWRREEHGKDYRDDITPERITDPPGGG